MDTIMGIIYFGAILVLTIFYTAIISSHVKTVSFNGMQGFIDSWFSQLGCGLGLAVVTVMIGGGLILSLITSKIFWGIVAIVAVVAIFGRDSSEKNYTPTEAKKQSEPSAPSQSTIQIPKKNTQSSTKFCKNCGAKVSIEEKFCAKCGTKTE